MEKILIATDQSSQVLGISIFEIKTSKLLYSAAIQIKGKSLESRIATVKQTINSFIKEYIENYELAYMVFEGVQMQRNNVLTLETLSELLGVIKNNAYELHIPFLVYKPSEWRGHFHIAKGKKKREELKAEAIQIVKEKYNLEASDDQCEAILIGLCACDKLNAEETGWGVTAPKAVQRGTNRKKKGIKKV